MFLTLQLETCMLSYHNYKKITLTKCLELTYVFAYPEVVHCLSELNPPGLSQSLLVASFLSNSSGKSSKSCSLYLVTLAMS
jgi:hypothetical protein